MGRQKTDSINPIFMMAISGGFIPRLNLGLTATVKRVARPIMLCGVFGVTVLIGQSSQKTIIGPHTS